MLLVIPKGIMVSLTHILDRWVSVDVDVVVLLLFMSLLSIMLNRVLHDIHHLHYVEMS